MKRRKKKWKPESVRSKEATIPEDSLSKVRAEILNAKFAQTYISGTSGAPLHATTIKKNHQKSTQIKRN